MTTCPRCPATWFGLALQHCPAVNTSRFTLWPAPETEAGDRHRTGRHDTSTGPNRRRCRTVEEMTEKGMTRNASGYWTRGRPASDWWRDVREGSQALESVSQNARGGRSGTRVPPGPLEAPVRADTRGDG